jgi:hypothetical protein
LWGLTNDKSFTFTYQGEDYSLAETQFKQFLNNPTPKLSGDEILDLIAMNVDMIGTWQGMEPWPLPSPQSLPIATPAEATETASSPTTPRQPVQKQATGNKSMTLGESVPDIAQVVREHGLPGLRGGYLGPKRLTDEKMRALSDEFQVEFAQIYTAGPLKNGGGGYYTLYSGTINTVEIPLGSGIFLINHTHPGGTVLPSTWDVDYLGGQRVLYQSPQRSSVILPKGKSASKFNENTPTSNKREGRPPYDPPPLIKRKP